jgi:DNA-binding NtrC family response regulator
VLVTGETGTGKEMIARALHFTSKRHHRPFVAVNCAAIPRELIEAELFGHEKGAFTGAAQRRVGRIEAAAGGTLFLDEIGELDLSMQSKLLRVLQEKEFSRLGNNRSIEVDFRLIASTNRDLREEIARGHFREDLFYRINVFPIHIPPLRERTDDIPALASFFLDSFSRAFGRDFRDVSAEASEFMKQYKWPGNIRELRNVIERICIMGHGPTLLPEHLPQEIRGIVPAALSSTLSGGTAPLLPADAGLDDAVMEFEKTIIRQALDKTRGNVLQTANLLKIPRGTLRYKMDKYGL